MFRIQFRIKCKKSERVAQSMRAQRVKPSAKHEFSGAFANFERLKLKEGQKIYREHTNMKCSEFNFLLNAKKCERVAQSMRAQRAKIAH